MLGAVKTKSPGSCDVFVPARKSVNAKPSQVREGTAVQYVVRKPPESATYANATVERIVRVKGAPGLMAVMRGVRRRRRSGR